MPTLKTGSVGADVTKLQTKLKKLGFDPKGVDGKFGPGTKKALIAFQKSNGLKPDGIAGPKTLAALQLDDTGKKTGSKAGDAGTGGGADAGGGGTAPDASVDKVARMFPGVPVNNLKENLPLVLKALADAGLGDKDMILMALATIRAETGNFTPLSEFKSKFNTSPGGHSFNLYDNREDLGNQGAPDGANFRGRGYIQLTGRANFREHGNAIGMGNQLIDNPTLANQPDIAAKLLASFLKAKESQIRAALGKGNLKLARKLVNGGSHGLAEFTAAFHIGEKVLA